LKKEVQELKLSNAVLTAEVEMYRKDAALPSFSKMALGGNQTASKDMMEESKSAPMEFVASGNGTYPRDPAVSLPNLHGPANPLCCTLDSSDSILVVGGANSSVTITNWGCALAPSATAIHDTVSSAHTVSCPAPVICVKACSGTDKIIAAGCMDGSVCFIGFDRSGAWPLKTNAGTTIKYSKYVKAMAWSPSSNVLVTASADGTVQISKVSLQSDNDMMDDDDDTNSRQITIEIIKSLHLKGAIETLCFVDDDTFCLYQRDTCYLSYFDLKEDCALTTYSLNGGKKRSIYHLCDFFKIRLLMFCYFYVRNHRWLR
jgi:WD40 repeat protein